jgi:hypothetical protein
MRTVEKVTRIEGAKHDLGVNYEKPEADDRLKL